MKQPFLYGDLGWQKAADSDWVNPAEVKKIEVRPQGKRVAPVARRYRQVLKGYQPFSHNHGSVAKSSPWM